MTAGMKAEELSRASAGKCGATNRAMAMARPRRTRWGTPAPLNGGATCNHAVARTMASRKAESQATSRERCNGSGQQAGHAGPEILRVVDHLGEHPVPADQDGDPDGDELGHEGERRLLQLGGRLHEADEHTHQQ